MAKRIDQATKIEAAGTPPKTILEIVGLANTKTSALSIAHMKSPRGWTEPRQTPEFEEWTYVLSGMLRVESAAGTVDVAAGQGIHAPAGEWVRYSTPDASAEYIAVCVPAFSPSTVHRDS